MKKLSFVLAILFFASSSSATIYKWVDEGGLINFSNDFSKVPLGYRDKVDEMSIPSMDLSTFSQFPPGNITDSAQAMEDATEIFPVTQNPLWKKDLAIKLAEALKVGHAHNEAEAEDMLALSGITLRNGWIADNPVTSELVEELQNVISSAADSGKLEMGGEEAIKAIRLILPFNKTHQLNLIESDMPIEPL